MDGPSHVHAHASVVHSRAQLRAVRDDDVLKRLLLSPFFVKVVWLRFLDLLLIGDQSLCVFACACVRARDGTTYLAHKVDRNALVER